MINIATSGVTNIFLGTSGATAVYLGSDLVWSTGGHDYSKDYFTLKALQNTKFSWPVDDVEYSLNDGNWTAWDSATTLSVVADDKVRFRNSTRTDYTNLNIDSSGEFEAEGNIMSLQYGDNFQNQTTLLGSFRSIFQGNRKIKSAENLILPATTLVDACYSSMFYSCASLTKAPKLPATNLAKDCYNMMFMSSALKDAPDLPATTLAEGCYGSMFWGCGSLEKAPILSATTLAKYSYRWMFRNCSSINYIKCLATDISAASSTSGWLQNVSATGTFVKAAGMNNWGTGANGIPTDWTVVDA